MLFLTDFLEVFASTQTEGGSEFGEPHDLGTLMTLHKDCHTDINP